MITLEESDYVGYKYAKFVNPIKTNEDMYFTLSLLLLTRTSHYNRMITLKESVYVR